MDDAEDYSAGPRARACLPVAPECPADPDRPPATAEEYLAHVRRQARGVADVVVADAAHCRPVRPSRRSRLPGAFVHPYLPPALIPPRAWRSGLLRQFRSLRAALADRPPAGPQRPPAPAPTLPAGRNDEEWQAFLFGGEGRPPTASLLRALDHPTVNWLLQRLVVWLLLPAEGVPLAPPFHFGPDGEGDGCDAPRDAPDAGAPAARKPLDLARRLARRDGAGCWLYGLLGRVDAPLIPDNQHALHDLLRSCCRARHALALAEAGVPSAAPSVGILAVLIVLAADYFRQASPDRWDALGDA